MNTLPPDIHTHQPAPAWDAIINLPMSVVEGTDSFVPREGQLYSAGIFPLYEGSWETAYRHLIQLASHPGIAAIGECGLDRRSTIPLSEQIHYFQLQMQLADQLHLPLIIHCVRCWGELLACHSSNQSEGLHIIHGFRGKPALARQLLNKGFNLSFGMHFPVESFLACPPARRYCETDDVPSLTLQQVIDRQQELVQAYLATHPDR